MIRLYKYILFSAVALALTPACESMVARSIARNAVAATRLIPAVAAPKIFTRALRTTPVVTQKGYQQIKPVVTQQHDKKPEYDNYAKSNSYKWAAIGAAVMLGHVGYQVAQCQEEENRKYGFSFESDRKIFYEYLKSRPWGKTVKGRLEECENEYQEWLQKWCKLGKITPSEWEAYVHDNIDSCKIKELNTISFFKNNKRLDDLSRIRAHAMMELLGLDKARIELVCRREGFQHPIGSVISCIMICPEECKVFFKNDEQFQAAFLHELQHLFHNDYAVGALIEKFGSASNNIWWGDLEESLKQFRHLTEKRADILAGLVDPKYAQSLADAFLELKNPSPELVMWGFNSSDFYKEHDSHPSDASRVANLNQLHKDMLAEIESNKGDIK